MDARINDLTTLIRSTYSGKVMDFSAVARFFTLDVLSTIAFGGRPFGFLAANEDLWDYDKLAQMFYPVFQVICHHTIPRRILQMPGLREAAVPKYTDKTGIGPALAVAHKAVAERYGPDAKVRNDMLGHFVSKGLSQTQCEAEAFLQVIAGSDSTTTVLRSTLYLLLGTPSAYAKLRSELDSALTDDRIPTYAETQRLQYLQACIWEGLRMYPPLGDLKTKVAPPEGDTIKGIYFPPGTEVALNDEAMCRDKAIFGEDAELFRPERWIEVDADAEKRVKYRQTVDTVFGTGRFQCLGRHIAMSE
jgi:cytochrome P450